MEELLDCMICFERFSQPKVLSCGHTFCCRCLDDYHKTNRITRRELDDSRVCCPTCRQPTPWPENGASGLRTDFKATKIQEFLDSLKLPSNSSSSSSSSSSSPSRSPKPLKQHEHCVYCLSVKKKIASYVYCVSCEKDYCKDCNSKHKFNPVFADHITIPMGKNDQKTNGHLSNNCEIHPKEGLKYVCVTCNTAVCTLCVMNEHQQDEVVSAEEFLKEKGSIVKELMVEVSSRKEDLKKQLEEVEPARVASEQACLESEKLIKKRSESLINDVKKREADLLAQVRKIKEKQLAPVQKEVERLKFHLSKVKAIERMANNRSMTLKKSFSTYSVLIQRMKTLLEVDFIPDQNTKFSSNALKFTPGSNQLGFGVVEKDNRFSKHDSTPEFQNAEIPMGRCNKREVNCDLKVVDPPMLRASSAEAEGRPSQKNLRRGSVHEMSQDVKLNASKKNNKNDGTPEQKSLVNPLKRASKYDATPEMKAVNPMCKQTSVDFSPIKLIHKIFANGSQPGELSQASWLAEVGRSSFVVSDCGNRRVQIFQTSGNLLSLISDDFSPMGLAVTSKRNIIVCDRLQKMVQVFSPEGKLISKWGSGKFLSPCDVAVCANGDMIISDLGDNSVSLYKNESKKVLFLGGSLFKEPRYVASGPSNEIIVTDCKEHVVKVFDSRGKLLAKMGGEGGGDGSLSSPSGVCCMPQGHLVVADTGNNRLSTFSLEGSFLGHMQVDVTSPRAVTKVGGRYLVVSEFESCNSPCAVKVFEVK